MIKCNICSFEQNDEKDYDKNHINYLHDRNDLYREMIGIMSIDPNDIIAFGKLAQKRIHTRKQKEEKKGAKDK